MPSMKAVVIHDDEDIRYEDVPQPEVVPGTIKVRVRATGICGSDVPRVFHHTSFFYPIILGHEFAGEVVETGEGVTAVKAGDRIVGAPLVPCMKCADCLKGNYAPCKNYSFMGSKQQGSMAEYIVMPEMCAVPYGEGISFEQAAMFEPATVGIHGLFCAGFQGGGDVAIMGGGTIGLFVLQWARIFGAKTVTVFDIDEERLEFLRGYGADYAINTKNEGHYEAAMDITRGSGFDTVFETAGQPFTMNLAFRIAGIKSSVCFIGTPHTDIKFPPLTWELMNRKEFRLTGSWMSYSAPYPGREWTLVAHHLAKGDLRIEDDLIYKKYPLSEGRAAFMNFKEGPVRGKVILTNEAKV